ncbi:hypothetical protein [Desulfovibrio sp.]|uniref:hypothetical protein n=1 Tax=Desulfovibrio sp. TaxID=885 RepID=UPI0025C07D40|nr:hypothetical protein [Desulfovibrio sp.]
MRVAYKNFTGGEVTPTLSARYDLGRYANSLKIMENFLPNLHGDAYRRPGTYFLENLGEDCVLLPFSFNAEAGQNFALAFGEKSLRIVNVNGYVVAEAMESPYALAGVPEISYAQVGDVVYLAHKDYALHKVVRTGSAPAYAWSIGTVALNTSLAAPAAPTAAWQGGGGSYTLRYKVSAVDADGKESLPSAVGSTASGKYPTDWTEGNHCVLSWQAVEGAAEYNIYRESAGYYGFIGIAQGTSFDDQNYEADIADTPKEDWDPFADGNNPGTVTFHQQRMVLAGTRNSPQSFYMSRTGDFENFRKSRPLQDDDPVEYQLASGTVDGIVWASSFGDLLLGTASAEYKATGDNGAITAKNCTITAQSYWGSAKIAPIIIGNSVMHCQRHGSRVRDLYYSLEKDGYAGNDLSVLAPHLFDGHTIRQWAFQQTPGSVLWVVRDDGVLLALTYMKEQDIWGWSRQITDGRVRSVAALSGENADELLLVVERSVDGARKYYLERLMPRWEQNDDIRDAFFVDCGLTGVFEDGVESVGGLSHLEGRTVHALLDGSPVEGLEVRDGAVALPYAARTVSIGLPYASTLCPQCVEADTQTGSTLGMKRGYGQCAVRLFRSVGGKFGTDRKTLYNFPFVPARWGEPCEPFSGDVRCSAGGGQDPDTSFYIVQDRPLPMQVAAIVVSVDFGQQG